MMHLCILTFVYIDKTHALYPLYMPEVKEVTVIEDKVCDKSLWRQKPCLWPYVHLIIDSSIIISICSC
jgi:hypothetical protein